MYRTHTYLMLEAEEHPLEVGANHAIDYFVCDVEHRHEIGVSGIDERHV